MSFNSIANMPRSFYVDGPHLLSRKVVNMRGASVNDISATKNCGVHIFCGPNIPCDDFHALREEGPLLGCADENSYQIPALAELIHKMTTEESGRSSD